MEEELFAGRDGHPRPPYQMPVDQVAADEDANQIVDANDGNQIAATPTKASDTPLLFDDS